MVTIPGYTQLVITGTAESHNSFFISKLQNPNPFRIRFLLRKLLDAAAGVRVQKIQSMHTSGSFPFFGVRSSLSQPHNCFFGAATSEAAD